MAQLATIVKSTPRQPTVRPPQAEVVQPNKSIPDFNDNEDSRENDDETHLKGVCIFYISV